MFTDQCKDKAFLKTKKKRQQDNSSNYHELTTSDDFLNQAVEEEEAGDRFTLLDLSKSLRFYQKAYEYYLQAAEIDCYESPNALDAMYNSSRLLFHVYNEFVKDDIVNFQYDLKSIEQVVNSDYLVLQSLTSICKQHEKAVVAYERFLLKNEQNIVPWDLYSNLCLVYTELIETTTDLSMDLFKKYINRTVQLNRMVLDYQVLELQKIVEEFDKFGDKDSFSDDQNFEKMENSENDNTDQEFASQESIIPGTVLETVISAYSFIQSCYEVFQQSYERENNGISTISAQDLKDLKDYATPIFDSFSKTLDMIAANLQAKFPPSNDEHMKEGNMGILRPLAWEDLVNLEITKIFIKSLLGSYNDPQSVEEFNLLWSRFTENVYKNKAASDTLFVATEMNTIIADSYQIFLEHNISKLLAENGWKMLTIMSSYFRKSQDGLVAQLKEVQERAKKNPNESVELSKIVSKLVEIIISRVDIDVTKVNSPKYAGFRARELQSDSLKKNIAVNLQNCMRYLGMNVGLRESIFDKLTRREKKFKVMTRRYILGLVDKEAMKVDNSFERELIRGQFELLKQSDAYSGFKFPF